MGRDRSRSRSPQRDPERAHRSRPSRHEGHPRRAHDARSRSPERKRRRRSHEGRGSSRRHEEASARKDDASRAKVPATLPFSARKLSKTDLESLRPLLAYYLDVQKQKFMEEMDEREIKGRWKSFVGKWNRGELAEGWYDPETFARAATVVPQVRPKPVVAGSPPERESPRRGEEDESDEEDYGPTLPTAGSGGRQQAGASIPSLQDLAYRDEIAQEDASASLTALRASRKADRAMQKERLDDLTPRAEAGTRERALEKRALLNEKLREFRDKSPGAMEAGDEKELMGGGDEVEEYKRMKERETKRKTERQIRKEEVDRARREEVEERRRAWVEREEGTISMLKELAKQRYG